MLIIIKHRYYYYRRFEQDIWGLCFLDLRSADIKLKDYYEYKKGPLINERMKKIFKKKGDLLVHSANSWLLRFFYRLFSLVQERKFQRQKRYIYRIDKITRIKRRRKFDKRFISLRLARLYFLTIKDHQFRKIFKTASKLDGNLEENYCLILECRVLALFYRTNFMCNLFDIIRFIKNGNVYLDFKKVKNINGNIKVNSFLTCSHKSILTLQSNLRKRLNREIVLFSTPKFLFVSYFFFFSYLMKKPRKKDFVYPFSLDIQRITGYN